MTKNRRKLRTRGSFRRSVHVNIMRQVCMHWPCNRNLPRSLCSILITTCRNDNAVPRNFTQYFHISSLILSVCMSSQLYCTVLYCMFGIASSMCALKDETRIAAVELEVLEEDPERYSTMTTTSRWAGSRHDQRPLIATYRHQLEVCRQQPAVNPQDCGPNALAENGNCASLTVHWSKHGNLWTALRSLIRLS